MNMNYKCLVSFFLLFALTSNQGIAQAPGRQELGAILLGGNSASTISGTFKSATGTAGTATGWTLFTYGDGVIPESNAIYIEATVLTKDRINLTTVNSANVAGSTSTLADFDKNQSYSWKLLTNQFAGGRIYLGTVDEQPVDVNDPTTFFDLTNPANKAAAEARLNSVLVFDNSAFRDFEGTLITTAIGNFWYTFEDFNPTEGYQSIHLNYAPVPEPVGLGFLGFVGLWALRWRRIPLVGG